MSHLSIIPQITAGDRVSGGTSFYVSTQGTRPPNTLSVVSEMKMNVYIAPQVLQRFPHTKITYSRMVQQFAVEIAVHMVRRRELAKKVPSPTIVEPTMRGIRQPLIPQSTTPWHVFYGRPPGVLESLISAQLGSLPVFTPQDESPPVSTPSPPALQASLPALPASLPVPPSLNVFAKGNEVAKEPSQGLGSDVWDISDVKSGKDSEAWLDAGQRGKGGDPALGGKLTSGRMPEVCNLVVALEKRVEELEQINRAHEHELASLRQVFKDVLDGTSYL
ncbi:hypothetical protein BD309DRAFT_561321 [Dichomitus squalens]|nr:hypothetical protein BD309DRAFT_561321 [Dichomitus squalens]